MSDIERLADQISADGIRSVFGIPGSGPSLTLIDALERRSVQFHLTHFEGTAVIMAGTAGRLSGIPSAAIGIKGPGLANMIPGMAACRLEALPVVTLTEAYPPGSSRAKSHKRLDHPGLVAAVSKGHRYLSRSGPQFADLTQWAAREVPGPVHLDIAATGIDADQPIPVTAGGSGQAASTDRAVERIRASCKPVIIAGTLAVRRKWSRALNRMRIPVFTTAAAKGGVDETLPPSAGVFTGAGLELSPERTILPRADLIVGLGLRSNEVLGAGPFHCPSIQIDPAGVEASPGFDFDLLIDAASDSQQQQVLDALAEKEWGLEETRGCIRRLREHLLEAPFLPAQVFKLLEHHFDHDARLVLDTGHFCTIGEHIWRTRDSRGCLGSGQGRYMGIGLPMAVAAALTDPEIPTILATGDGGIGMYPAEAKLAVRLGLPLMILLMSDGHLGSIRSRALKDGLTQSATRISQPSWLEVFAGFGLPVFRAASRSQLQDVLGRWQPRSGPIFVEIPFDPDAYQHMSDRIR